MQGRIQTTCLVILATVAVGAGLYWLRSVLIPFVLAVFIAISLGPLVDLQTRYARLPRSLALVTTLLLALVLLSLLALLVSTSVRQLAANADAYGTQLAALIDRVLAVLPQAAGDLVKERDIRQFFESPAQTVGGLLLGTTNAILDVLSKSLLVFMFVAFLLIGSERRPADSGMFHEIRSSVQRFLVTKAVISGATGVLVGVTLSLLGVDLAMVFGLMAFLLNFIPSLGSIVATLLPIPVVLVSPQLTGLEATLAIAIPGVIQISIGNFIEPRVMGRRLDLHPVTVLLTLVIWGAVWGIVGMLLATPITAILKMVLERFEGARPIAEFMAGRLPGTAATAD